MGREPLGGGALLGCCPGHASVAASPGAPLHILKAACARRGCTHKPPGFCPSRAHPSAAAPCSAPAAPVSVIAGSSRPPSASRGNSLLSQHLSAAGQQANGFPSPDRASNLAPAGPYANGGPPQSSAMPIPSAAMPIPPANSLVGGNSKVMEHMGGAESNHGNRSGGGNTPPELAAAAARVVAGGLPAGHRTGSRPSTPTTSLESQVRCSATIG